MFSSQKLIETRFTRFGSPRFTKPDRFGAHSVHPPLSAGKWVEPLTKLAKKRAEGGGEGKEGYNFWEGGGLQCLHKKLKSEIFNEKKSL